MSLSAVRIEGDLRPFWRPRTRRLVVIVARAAKNKLIAWGVDPNPFEPEAFVFEATFAAHRLRDFIAVVLGGEKTVIESGKPDASKPDASRTIIVRLPSPGGAAFARAAAVSAPEGRVVVVPDRGGGGGPRAFDPERDVVVVPDRGGSGGPRVLALARTLATANDEVEQLSFDDSDDDPNDEPDKGSPSDGAGATPT